MNNYKPYKGRRLDPSKPLEMYRCLNRKGKTFSIRQNGLVVGHTREGWDFWLHNCQFVVNEAGKIKCHQDQQRNVHAFVRGYYLFSLNTTDGAELFYDPYSERGFCTEEGEVKSAKFVIFTDDGVFCEQEIYTNVSTLQRA